MYFMDTELGQRVEVVAVGRGQIDQQIAQLLDEQPAWKGLDPFFKDPAIEVGREIAVMIDSQLLAAVADADRRTGFENDPLGLQIAQQFFEERGGELLNEGFDRANNKRPLRRQTPPGQTFNPIGYLRDQLASFRYTIRVKKRLIEEARVEGERGRKMSMKEQTGFLAGKNVAKAIALINH